MGGEPGDCAAGRTRTVWRNGGMTAAPPASPAPAAAVVFLDLPGDIVAPVVSGRDVSGPKGNPGGIV